MQDRLLVIATDPSVGESLSAFLEADGFQVLTTSDGSEGVRLADEYRPDLVIMDVETPLVGGRPACAQLRALGDMPILMLTLRPPVDPVVAGFEAGADDCMGAPRLVELEAHVRALLRRAHRTPAPAAENSTPVL